MKKIEKVIVCCVLQNIINAGIYNNSWLHINAHKYEQPPTQHYLLRSGFIRNRNIHVTTPRGMCNALTQYLNAHHQFNSLMSYWRCFHDH